MNMTVSLLIPVVGYAGGIEEELLQFIGLLPSTTFGRRYHTGSEQIELMKFRRIKTKIPRFRLLPGFVLQDRSAYLRSILRV